MKWTGLTGSSGVWFGAQQRRLARAAKSAYRPASLDQHCGLRRRASPRTTKPGPEISTLNLAALDKERQKAVKDALGGLKNVTLTVIDGDFPREDSFRRRG